MTGLVTGLVEGGDTCFGSGSSSSLLGPVGHANSLLLLPLLQIDFSIGRASPFWRRSVLRPRSKLEILESESESLFRANGGTVKSISFSLKATLLISGKKRLG